MRSEINRATTRFNDLQWQLQDALEALHETMKANSVNEQLALSQLDKVLDGEREIKRAHMELAIRIKNKLTQEQQTKLHSMRRPMDQDQMDPNEVDQVDQMGQNEDRPAGLVAGWTAARSRTKTASPTAGRPFPPERPLVP